MISFNFKCSIKKPSCPKSESIRWYSAFGIRRLICSIWSAGKSRSDDMAMTTVRGGNHYGIAAYYAMMAAMYSSMSSGSNEEYTTELDKDRFYNAVLTGPTANAEFKPNLKVTFSAPLTAE